MLSHHPLPRALLYAVVIATLFGCNKSAEDAGGEGAAAPAEGSPAEATEALKAKIKNLAKAAAVNVKNKRVPSGRLTVKGDPAKLDCAGVDLKALKEATSEELEVVSAKFRKPHVCTFQTADKGLRLVVTALVGKRNLSESRVANMGNPWTQDKGLPVNVMTRDKLGMATVYADFGDRHGLEVRASIGVVRKRFDGKEVAQRGAKLALELCHRFRAQLKGFKPKDKVVDVDAAMKAAADKSAKRQAGKAAAGLDCAKLDLAAVSEAAGGAVTLKKQRKPTRCEFSGAGGLRLNLRTSFMSDKKDLKAALMGTMVPSRQEPKWAHQPGYDQFTVASSKMPMFSAAVRLSGGGAFSLIISASGPDMLKYLKDPKALKGFEERGLAVVGAMRETLKPTFAN